MARPGVLVFLGLLGGGQPIRGLLLEGPPGTGKSYLGQAIATEAQLPFGYMSAPSIQGMFWGLQQQMKAARQQGIHLDEVSYVGGKPLPDGTSMQFYLVGVRQQSDRMLTTSRICSLSTGTARSRRSRNWTARSSG